LLYNLHQCKIAVLGQKFVIQTVR